MLNMGMLLPALTAACGKQALAPPAYPTAMPPQHTSWSGVPLPLNGPPQEQARPWTDS
jgi:hypothetical protein